MAIREPSKNGDCVFLTGSTCRNIQLSGIKQLDCWVLFNGRFWARYEKGFILAVNRTLAKAHDPALLMNFSHKKNQCINFSQKKATK
jgi:hypothetical protein